MNHERVKHHAITMHKGRGPAIEAYNDSMRLEDQLRDLGFYKIADRVAAQRKGMGVALDLIGGFVTEYVEEHREELIAEGY